MKKERPSYLRKAPTCPRCGTKYFEGQKRCNTCRLLFERLEKATNFNAKAEILHGHKENVVYTTKLPRDISKVALLLYTIFLGFFGVQNLYVGKFLKGIFMLVVGLITAVLTTITIYSQSYDIFMKYFSIFIAIGGIMWIFDVGNVIIGKFKVPVAMEIKK